MLVNEATWEAIEDGWTQSTITVDDDTIHPKEKKKQIH